MLDPFFWLFAALVLFLAVMLQVWLYRKGVRQVQHWAQTNGYHLLNFNIRFFRRGPYMWLASRAQMVFRFQVRDNQGVIHSGYMRVGGFFMGVFSDQIDVIWDQDPRG